MGRKSNELCEEIHIDSTALPEKWQEPVESFLMRFHAIYQLRCAVLYGSVARGDYGPYSDIDLILISDCIPSDFLARLRRISDLYEWGTPIEALAYTSEEFHQMIEDMHVTALDATTQGLPLVNAAVFEEFRSHTAELKRKGLWRGKTSWIMGSPKT